MILCLRNLHPRLCPPLHVTYMKDFAEEQKLPAPEPHSPSELISEALTLGTWEGTGGPQEPQAGQGRAEGCPDKTSPPTLAENGSAPVSLHPCWGEVGARAALGASAIL